MSGLVESYAAWKRNRTRMIAYGRWDPFRPAADAEAIISTLRGYGMSIETIAAASGVSIPTVSALAYENSSYRRGKVTVATLERLRRVSLDYTGLPPAAKVAAAGTARRIHALQAIGWPLSAMARALGVSTQAVQQMTRRDKVTAGNAAAVKALYDTRSMTFGPSTVTRNHAARAGYAPPLAWDDDTIDDPAAEPAGLEGGRQKSRDQLVEDVTELVADGATVASACARLGKDRRNLERTLQRAGRHDLWRALTGTTPSAGRSVADVEAEDGGAA